MDIVVSNPINLNEVSLSITRVIDKLEDDYLLVFDSVSGLLLRQKVRAVFTRLYMAHIQPWTKRR